MMSNDDGCTVDSRFIHSPTAAIFHSRIKAAADDNSLSCGWCTLSFKRCFPCIMQDSNEENKRKNWRKLVHHPKFKNASDARWQDIQVHFVAEMNWCMSNTHVLALYGYRSVEDYKHFLTGTKTDQVLLEIFTLEKKTSEVAHEEWPCVDYYCMTMLGALLTPLDPNRISYYDANFFRETQALANKLCRTDAIIKKLFGYLRGSHDVVERIRASSVLTCFAGASRDVTQLIADRMDLTILVDLFTAGYFSKLSATRRDKAYPRYVRILLSLAVKDSVDDTNPNTITDDECFYRCRKGIHNVIGNAGQVLYNVASLSPDMACKVFEWPGFLPAWLKWLRHPMLVRMVDQTTAASAAHLLEAFVHSRVLAKCLVEEKNLLVLLERLLYTPHDFPLDIYVCVVKVLISHGGLFVDKIARNENVLFAVGCYVYCPMKSIQDQAMPVVASLYKNKPHVIKVLHSKGIITQDLMFTYSDSLAWDDDVRTWSTLITQRAKRALGHRWRFSTDDLAKPDSKNNFTWENMKEEGNKYFKLDNYEEALRWYRSGVIIAPAGKEIAVLHSNSAECYLRLNLYTEVVREATLSIAAAFCESPIYIKTLYRRAKAFYMLKRPFEALGDISVCLWKKPDDPRFQELHSQILKDYKKLPDAVYKLHMCEACRWVGEGHKKCAQCLKVYFCSAVCQRRAWPAHKLRCEQKQKHGKDNVLAETQSPRKAKSGEHNSDRATQVACGHSVHAQRKHGRGQSSNGKIKDVRNGTT